MSEDWAYQDALFEEIARLKTAFVERLTIDLAQMSGLAGALTGAESDRDLLADIQHRLHKIAGSGGTFGYAELGKRARALEQTVRRWLDDDLNIVGSLGHKDFIAGLTHLGDSVTADSRPDTAEDLFQSVGRIGRQRRVWIVDVLAADTIDLARHLEQFGYNIQQTEILPAEPPAADALPDALILDQSVVDALDDILPSWTDKIPILMTARQDLFAARVRAARRAARGYFIRPLDVTGLVDCLDQALAGGQGIPGRVLIVDDDVILADHFRLVLTAAGFEVLAVNDPALVIEQISAFRPELVLMDLRMPGISGPDLAATIRLYHEWVGLPIVYLSAESDLDRQIAAMERGADDFLTKPISDARLAAAVKSRIRRARQLADLMSNDSLTGLLKHGRIMDELRLAIARGRRMGRMVSVVMIDIDNFKSVNDRFGHAAGDVVIKSLAHQLRQRLRQTDGVGRYGGEEFLAVLPDCSAEQARTVIEFLREGFNELRFHQGDHEFSCTLSAGIADTSADPRTEAAEVLSRADSALYAAKQSGRNRVVIAAG